MDEIRLPVAFSHDLPTPANSLGIFSKWTSILPIPGATVGYMPLFDAEQDMRVLYALRAFGPMNEFDVLDLGSFEGGHSYQLEQCGARSVLGIEANPEMFIKSLLVKEALGLKSEFLYGDFVKYLERTDKEYDLIFASAVLCHMSDPLHLLHLIAERASRTFIWTEYVEGVWGADSFDVEQYGVTCRYHRYEYDPEAEERSFCGIEPYCCRLRKDDILGALSAFGFRHVELIKDDVDAPGGANMSLVARK
jgi:hypothetical protein